MRNKAYLTITEQTLTQSITMASSTVFDLLSVSLGKSIETIMIPNFAEVAAQVASQFGDEPPSQDSMKVLFIDAFKKSLANPGKKTTKPKTPKKEAKTSDKTESKPKKPKTPKSPKAKRTLAPKPQWLSLNEMKEKLDGTQHFCGFVADRGPNKGKFCATVLTEEHKNCGILTADGWTPHTPDQEFESVDKLGHKMRCKKCWAKNKTGCYRKQGAAEKIYSEEIEKAEKEFADMPEIPDVPNNDVKNSVEDELDDKLLEKPSTDDDEESEDDLEECPTDDEEGPTTEELLDGLLDSEVPASNI